MRQSSKLVAKLQLDLCHRSSYEPVHMHLAHIHHIMLRALLVLATEKFNKAAMFGLKITMIAVASRHKHIQECW